jgi:hypothetical protein
MGCMASLWTSEIHMASEPLQFDRMQANPMHIVTAGGIQTAMQRASPVVLAKVSYILGTTAYSNFLHSGMPRSTLNKSSARLGVSLMTA